MTKITAPDATMLEMKGYRVHEARAGEEANGNGVAETAGSCSVGFGVGWFGRPERYPRFATTETNANLPIVIVSGWDPIERKDEALAAGCNEYLLKPINFDILEPILGRYVPLGTTK